MQNKTKINWSLNDYCKSECSYCPVSARGGLLPPETQDYIRVAKLLIDNYASMGRTIDWSFNGGEPLDMNDIVTLLKLCRESSSSMELTTNGGRLWMDWWAIEPYVDSLHLSYHYWQQPALIKYIVGIFKNKNKLFEVTASIRPNYFDDDIARVLELETAANIRVNKTILYTNADSSAGMFPYTKDQLLTISRLNGNECVDNLINEKEYFESTTWDDRYREAYRSNPIYTGNLCNAGIEYLNIGAQGWVSGSSCNNLSLGNIWQKNWQPPTSPQKCTMIACVYESDQQITKFQ
jgi:MoaA/NifB/PqqE/SkfB family radical SAM enzyme